MGSHKSRGPGEDSGGGPSGALEATQAKPKSPQGHKNGPGGVLDGGWGPRGNPFWSQKGVQDETSMGSRRGPRRGPRRSPRRGLGRVQGGWQECQGGGQEVDLGGIQGKPQEEGSRRGCSRVPSKCLEGDPGRDPRAPRATGMVQEGSRGEPRRLPRRLPRSGLGGVQGAGHEGHWIGPEGRPFLGPL